MTQSWLLYGVRTAYCSEVVEIIGRRGDTVTALVDNLDDGPQTVSVGSTIAPGQVDDAQRSIPAVIPLTTPGFRQRAVADAAKHGIVGFPPLVDPTAVVAASAQLSSGVVVNAGVVMGAATYAEAFVSINRSVSIGHDVVLGSFVTLAPGVVLGGSVVVERGAFIGIGATVLPGVRIGANAVVGGGAVVTADVPECAVVVGNPAHVVRVGTTGYQGGMVTDD
jgi:sugar O-acyltransferase (sialic acid O-acetyltransferase NeuD family)